MPIVLSFALYLVRLTMLVITMLALLIIAQPSGSLEELSAPSGTLWVHYTDMIVLMGIAAFWLLMWRISRNRRSS